MKKTGKILIAVLLIAVLAVTAIASTGSKKAELFYRDIKLTLNGQSVTPKDANGNVVEPFIIDGTTYLPVRAVSDALGLNVEWDSATSTVKLTEKGYADASKYSRTNPAPTGTAQTFTVSNYTNEYTATAVVNSVERGDAAWQKIKAANMFNDQPDAGKEYILANVSITLVSSKNDSAVSFAT
ncbi:MAG: copper amine oxidase N-terminal domain-containing protein [Oscillospiraceae bacterium]|nr:copper amine oxidase N-terminal domain-containing protein [Oscillospiraceae bacterium]